jgi:two-component system chemotaxis response regulator CheY
MRTLIVDDSSFIREYLRQMLRRLGTEYAEAENGFEALTLLRKGELFDLMLVDVNMPVMNGLECVRLLREEKLAPAMKVMMVTTEADHSYIETALNYGADEFLMKPFTQDSLREKLLLLDFEMKL